MLSIVTMIRYRTGSWGTKICNVLVITGSVFPRAAQVALPSAIFGCILRWGITQGHVEFLAGEVMKNSAVWNGFSTLVIFLVVFRTSQSYARFNDGASATIKMSAEWFDAASSLMAFCRFTNAPEDKVDVFKNTLIRLFSILHAVALGEIEDSCVDTALEVQAYKFELVDVDGIDDESLLTIMKCDSKVELLFQWIQQLCVENIMCGVLNIPPPILTRAFQEMANGMIAVNEAIRVSSIPFPFPYAQACDLLLFSYSVLAPMLAAAWVNEISWTFVFTFTQVFILWCLNFISEEVENPFGADPNDLDFYGLQQEMNKHLLLLSKASTMRLPQLTARACVFKDPNWDDNLADCRMSLFSAWTRIILKQTKTDKLDAKKVSLFDSSPGSQDSDPQDSGLQCREHSTSGPLVSDVLASHNKHAFWKLAALDMMKVKTTSMSTHTLHGAVPDPSDPRTTSHIVSTSLNEAAVLQIARSNRAACMHQARSVNQSGSHGSWMRESRASNSNTGVSGPDRPRMSPPSARARLTAQSPVAARQTQTSRPSASGLESVNTNSTRADNTVTKLEVASDCFPAGPGEDRVFEPGQPKSEPPTLNVPS